MKRQILLAIILLLSFTVLAFGANEIQFAYEDGDNLYALVRQPSDAFIWDVGDSQFEAVGTWNDARAGECDIALTGYNGELYMAGFPSAAAGRYIINIYLRAGASPAITDALLGTGEIIWNGSAEVTVIDTSGQVDVGTIEGSDATDQINAEADTALTDYDPPTKAELDSGLAALNDPSATDVVSALMADTGVTAGGTWTYEEWCKMLGAYLLGTWQDKSGTGSLVQEILDPEDDATVILELSASATSPYKTTTKK